MGVIARNQNGNVLGLCGKSIQVNSAEEGEARALALGIGLAKAMQFKNVMIENDCQNIIFYILGRPNSSSWEAH